MEEAKVEEEEARIIMTQVAPKSLDIALAAFRAGLEVELEHGLRFADANVTNNHPLLTGKIVLAHFYESLDYYQRLEVAELEGDLLKALAGGDVAKAQAKYRKLIKAREELAQAEARILA
ncbi:hypothetical protein AAU61_04350 [Desulfocarbo indianensis]|nr:hypothetical protein AAU61_04350 [Desulfocarbo indianensis]